MEVLFIIAIICFIGYIMLHRSADKMDERFANRPSVITNPRNDLAINQKYAIVALLAYTQGATERSAYSEQATNIVMSTAASLDLTKTQVEDFLQSSMGVNPDRCLDRMVASLREIRDRNYLKSVFSKAHEIAIISGDQETIDTLRDMYNDIVGY